MFKWKNRVFSCFKALEKKIEFFKEISDKATAACGGCVAVQLGAGEAMG